MSEQAWTAVTNFIVAGEMYFFAGLFFNRTHARFSASWLWAVSMLLMATNMMIGGIDHGFVENLFSVEVDPLERINWTVIGVMTLTVFAATARQYFKPSVERILLILAAVQFVIYLVVMFMNEDFLVVIINYAPVLLLLLVCTAFGLKNGTGRWSMVLGIVIAFIASGVQAADIDTFSPINNDGLYHIILFFGAIFLYLGGYQFKTR